MADGDVVRYGRPLLVAGVLVWLWGVVGLMQNRDHGYGGFFFGPDRVVTGFEEGGPGQKAGIQVGDRVVTVDGVRAEELPMQSRWEPINIGESREVEVERDGERIFLEVVYQGGDVDPVVGGIGNLIVNLAFLGLGLWVLFKVQSSLALLCALSGLFWALSTLGGPHLGAWEGVAGHIQITALLMWSYVLLRFLLVFPQAKKIGENRLVQTTLTGVFLAWCTLLIVELMVHPALYNVYGVVLLFLLIPVALGILVALIHSRVTCSAEVRRSSGFNLFFWGILGGLFFPFIVALLLAALTGVEGDVWPYLQLLQIAIPATMAYAVVKDAESQAFPAA
jgi:membrane-associated protease RseP (regulator of RpoE activity)